MPLQLVPDTGIEKKIEIKPFIKWAGGKVRLIPQMRPLFPTSFNAYHEPFLGSGAVFLHLNPSKAFLSDLNPDLINTWIQIRDNLDWVIKSLEFHKKHDSKDFFKSVRSTIPFPLPEQAARLIYLNKTCRSGLYRVNSSGDFNVPYGDYKNPGIFNPDRLAAISKVLSNPQIQISCCGYKHVLNHAIPGDFVYFDPPYYTPEGKGHTAYTPEKFKERNHIELYQVAEQLVDKGVQVMVSNSDEPFVRDLFSRPLWNHHTIQRSNSINSDGNNRKMVNELCITSYITPRTKRNERRSV